MLSILPVQTLEFGKFYRGYPSYYGDSSGGYQYYRGDIDDGHHLQEPSARGRKPRRAVVIHVSHLVLCVPPAKTTNPLADCRAGPCPTLGEILYCSKENIG